MLWVGCERSADVRPSVPATPDAAVPAPAPGPRKIALPERRSAAACTLDSRDVALIDDCVVACTKGDGEACATAATKYWGGVGVKLDRARSLELGAAGCKLGSADACAMAAAVHSQVEAFVDPVKAERFDRLALPLFERACAAGDYRACERAGDWYERAFGMKWLAKDPAKAATLTARAKHLQTKACDAGNGAACDARALDYTVGSGVLVDDLRAQSLRLRACKLGHATSCNEAATAILKDPGGKVVEVDKAERTRLLLESCALGLGKSCSSLPLFEPGADALAFHVRGCELRDANGCYWAASDFESRKDLTSALDYHRRACDLGSDNSCQALARLRH